MGAKGPNSLGAKEAALPGGLIQRVHVALVWPYIVAGLYRVSTSSDWRHGDIVYLLLLSRR